MRSLFAVLVLFLGIGLFTRTYNGRTRLLLIGIIIGLILVTLLTRNG